MPAGTAMSVSFVLDGVEVQALNGGPAFPFTEAFSFFVSVPDQAEVDRVWDALTADGGEPGRCGWLKDRWGLSWQVVPEALPQLLSDPDPGRASRAMNAMLAMDKIDVAALHAAADARAGLGLPSSARRGTAGATTSFTHADRLVSAGVRITVSTPRAS